MPPTKLYPLIYIYIERSKGEPVDLTLIVKENEKSVKKQLQAI